MDGDGKGKGQDGKGKGNGQGNNPGQGNGQGDFAKGGGQASGKRPLGDGGKTGSEEVQPGSKQDKGQINVVDHVPGQGFKGPRKQSEMTEDIKKASQDAPEALDRQRLPRSASDMAKGYFEKMAGPEKK